jgi:hypothetical protein
VDLQRVWCSRRPKPEHRNVASCVRDWSFSGSSENGGGCRIHIGEKLSESTPVVSGAVKFPEREIVAVAGRYVVLSERSKTKIASAEDMSETTCHATFRLPKRAWSLGQTKHKEVNRQGLVRRE